MRKHAFSVWLFLLLVGCSATPNQVRQSPPWIFETSKAPETVVNCLYEKYDGMGWQSMLSTVPRGDGGKTVKVTAGRTIKLLIDISPKLDGSSIRAYENFAVLPQERKLVAECSTGKQKTT